MPAVRWWLLPYLWKLKWRSKTDSAKQEGNKNDDNSLFSRLIRPCRKQTPDKWVVSLGVRGKAGNSISTSNYTIINFVPKFLFLQFKQFANLLFLALCIIQLIPGLSPFGFQSTMAPLVFIISCSAIRETYEEFRRRIRDRRVNYQLVWALTPKGWQKTRWCKIHVGQVVRVMEGEQIPADMVFISSSEPGGVGYIETANLDGESSLKVRQALGKTSHLVKDEDLAKMWQNGGEIVCDPPNKDIYKFTGYMKLTEGEKIPLSNANILLRGARLKNTDFAYGVIVYAGKNTKLRMNNTKRTIKRSRVAHMMNAVMLLQFGICMLLSLTAALFQQILMPRDFEHFIFPPREDKMTTSLGFMFLGCLMLFNGLVPISLYVTLEMIQVAQGLFIRADKEMIDSRDIGADVKMFSLNSELGEVKYVMTDKTGTLTQNNMRFRQCSVGGIKYANKKSQSLKPFKPERLLQHLETNEMNNSDLVREFLTSCAVCHTVNTDKHSDDNDRPLYHATSPDESALVQFAADAGFVFHSRVHPENNIHVKIADKIEKFTLLHLFEFSSDRKRMSVIVRKEDGSLMLYVKGADHMILSRLAYTESPRLLKTTKHHLHSFATAGFRTLCFAKRSMSEEEWALLKPKLDAAAVELNNQGLFADLAEEVEKNLTLIGVSAIEDRLQDEVPETIQRMMSSGMRVWILTGDKLETAVNIGNSCRLLNPKTPMLVLAHSTAQETKDELERVTASVGDKVDERLRLALIIDATSLDFLLNDEILKLKFLRLALCASAVICCRCTPLQKAAVTRLVKQNADGAVLAIGDGSNDVAMIQEADVGVGLAGEEGMQAALAADYSIAQFRFLDRLLFVHGTLSLFRTSKCILYSIYKNVMETTCLFFFTFRNGRTDQPMADQWTIVRYNIFFTSWPALIIGTMDRPAGVEFFKKYSQMYTLYHNPLNMISQLSWFGVGLLHGVTVIISMLLFWGEGAPLEPANGRDDTIFLFGIITYMLLVTIANGKAVLETSSITILSIITSVGSVLLLIIALIWDAYAWQFFPGQDTQLGYLIWHTPWPGTFFIWLFVCMCVYLPDITLKVVRHSVYKDVRDVILWKEGVRGPNFEALYLPIFKICDTVGLRPQQMDHGNGFAFSQDDGQVLSQMQLISGRFDDKSLSKKKTASTEQTATPVSTSQKTME